MSNFIENFDIMSFDRNIPFDELPDLPPEGFSETPEIMRLLVRASRHLGELNGLCAALPDPEVLINTILLQECKDSSAIENIVTTQDDLYRAATKSENASHAAREVLNYREALYAGFKRMKAQQDLLLTGTMVEIMQTIKQNQSGIRNTPGTALKNGLTGETVYTPPCGENLLRDKLSALEQFINDPEHSPLDPLIKMALIHYQFEAIHPFTDGNGRTGRIINALYLVQQELLTLPILYLSSYIVGYRSEYYRLLRGVTEKGNWSEWVIFMLHALIVTTRATSRKIRKMLILKEEYEKRMKRVLGASFSHELLQLMFSIPYLTIELLENKGLAHRQTASSWLKKLSQADLLKPRKMERTTYYINAQLMDILQGD